MPAFMGCEVNFSIDSSHMNSLTRLSPFRLAFKVHSLYGGTFFHEFRFLNRLFLQPSARLYTGITIKPACSATSSLRLATAPRRLYSTGIKDPNKARERAAIGVILSAQCSISSLK